MKRRSAFLLAIPAMVFAQAHDHSQMNHTHHEKDEAGSYLMSLSSGTSINPQSWPMPMFMTKVKSWDVMLMGQGFFAATQQSGPRGHDKIYGPNWGMISATHKVGRGTLMLQSMLSLDPATVTGRSYPLLFQTGETAYGKPLVDAQHPHDFFMGLGIHYAVPVSKDLLFHAYYAPVGDPALGPVAFPHRASAMELPQATLGHHWQDSTHIAVNVATVGLRHKYFRLEASGFHGAEPDEHRWNIDWGGMDSYSGRLSITPTRNWLAQVSAARIKSPEAHDPADLTRTTASLHYTRPTSYGNHWSTSLIWGRNHNSRTQQNSNSYLLESVYPVSRRNFVTGRAELVDKTQLFEDAHGSYRIQGYTIGYTRDVAVSRHLQAGIGANVTAYAIPDAIKPSYGERPYGVTMFLRFRLTSPR